MRKLILALTAAVAALGSVQATAAPMVETFDSYTPGVPWNGSGVWTTGNSVDLVASGTYNLTCVGGTGNCVDLSGDRSGSISTTVALAAGTYRLSFLATGNQLDAFGGPFPQSSVSYSIGTLTGSTGLLANNSVAFQSFGGLFTVTGSSLLTFTQAAGGNPYRGSILDNVAITAVPEPTTWAMMMLGFGMIGYGVRSHRKLAVRVTHA